MASPAGRAIATLPAGWLSFGGRLFALIFGAFLFAIQFQIHAMVEVGFLEHLAEVAGASLGRQCFFFIQVVVFGLAALNAARSLELFFLDDFFLNEAAAGSVA
jgi:hypothetical protein